MLRLAQICLITEIILAPLMLGGARPWAMAILSILTGAGLLAIAAQSRPLNINRYVILLWVFVLVLIGWAILQSLPVWPMQSYPFDAPHIALYPDAWMELAVNLIWLAATITLASLIAQSRPDTWVGLVVKSIIAACCLQLILAAINDVLGWQTTFWFAKTAHVGDWTGSFANRNGFGALMATGLVACLYLFARNPAQNIGRRMDQAGGYLALAILFGLAIVQSHSRSAIAITLIAAILFITLSGAPDWRSIAKRLAITITGAAGVIALLILTQPDLANRFAELVRLDLIQRDDALATALLAIQDRPLTGFGPDSVALIMGHFATPGLNANTHWFSSHNLWLDAALSFGLPALVAIFASAMIAAVFLIRSTTCRPDRALVIALIAMVIVSSAVGWVISLPALVLPVAILLIAVLEAGLEQHAVSPAHADHTAQSPVPDQAILH
ncbi:MULTISPECIES: O-antigen ligase family protein [Thalassospira]|uniref:O-antigen ligase-related domain-containing protein n=2 Tax=Thalassospira TaxID=168934 RepID=A0A367W9I6_9PROT|nr:MULTISPECIES: O-antigen ligase family protein [Thalassospira]MDG4718165.1 O-antigen ligase family protein [Thalassospira sp. FZY0004]RCK37929.1 hypothetical protein TH19_07875 [Thalassospira profundimaris]